MTLAAGSRIGPYEITAKLGEGGMGEVYRATDTRLRREVAIKVLPDAFVEDQERLARFEREAQLLAQLHHPNIASIFGLEEGDGTRALVLELVEGPTLAERLKSGPLPLEESLNLASQIAAALEEAHEKGIIHRDLKPQNVKAAIEGKVKVLDFGLAKAMDPIGTASGAASASQLAASPTLTLGATQLGMVLGTAAYMAPEQAKGFAVDKRVDIWAFGVVLFEMLTGASPFIGDSVPDTLARVLQRDVDFATLPESTPPAIRRLLRRCLERQPRRRLHDIADARIVIEDVLSGADIEAQPGANVPVAAARSRRATAIAALAVAAASGLAGFAIAGWIASDGAPVPAPQRYSIRLSPNQDLGSGGELSMAFSPDGSTLVFPGRHDGRQGLLRRRLDETAASVIAGTEGAGSPFFSPDGEWVGFSASGQLRKVPIGGGRPFSIADMRGAGGACWLADGTIVFAPIYSDGLFRITAAGGTPERLTTPDRDGGVLGHWWPHPLPGERALLFTAFRTPVDESRIGLLDLESRQVRWLVDGGFDPVYVATGHLLYVKAKRLFALPFDAAKGVATGPAVAVVDDLQASQSSAYGAYAVAPDGTLAFATETLFNPPRQLVWIDRQGRRSNVIDDARRFQTVSLSHDGTRIATTILGESRDLWTIAADRGVLSRLTTGPDTEFDPQWTADDRELIYVVDEPPFALYRIAVDSPDSGRPLWSEKVTRDTTEAVVSRDGRTVAFTRTEEGTGSDLFLRPLNGSAPERALRATRAAEEVPVFSPDGRWVAYASDESGRAEIYAERADGSGQRIQVSADGGREPVWAANGELFFRRDDEVRVVETRAGDRLEVGKAVTLFRIPLTYATGQEMRTYSVTADGSRVLGIYTAEESRPRQIEIVTSWLQQLPRLAPASRR